MKKILVVGKDPKLSEDLRKYFDPQEYRIFPSCDPKNTIVSVKNLKPSLIILELNLLPRWGTEIVEELKESNSNLPIIAITDSSSNLNKMDIIKEKVYAFVKTPIQPEKLSCMVKEALSTGMHRTVRPTGESQQVHTAATTEREKRELKGLSQLSGASESSERTKIDGSTSFGFAPFGSEPSFDIPPLAGDEVQGRRQDKSLTTNCEKIHEGYSGGKKDYDQMFDQLLIPIYEKIMVNSKGNIYDRLISGLEKSLISLTLKYCNHNQVKAAQILGISRNTLRERIKRYDLW